MCQAVCLFVSTTTIITSVDSSAICVCISNTSIGSCLFVPTIIQLLLTAVQFCGTQLYYIIVSFSLVTTTLGFVD